MMSELHSQELHDLALKHFNEPVLSSHELCRLIGYAETGIDCYFICKTIGTIDESGKVFWDSCVGGVYWLDRLKGQRYIKSTSGEGCDDFVRLDNLLELNGCPKEREFILKINLDDMEEQNLTKD